MQPYVTETALLHTAQHPPSGASIQLGASLKSAPNAAGYRSRAQGLGEGTQGRAPGLSKCDLWQTAEGDCQEPGEEVALQDDPQEAAENNRAQRPTALQQVVSRSGPAPGTESRPQAHWAEFIPQQHPALSTRLAQLGATDSHPSTKEPLSISLAWKPPHQDRDPLAGCPELLLLLRTPEPRHEGKRPGNSLQAGSSMPGGEVTAWLGQRFSATVLTLEMERGMLKSLPPCSLNPQGAGPSSITL